MNEAALGQPEGRLEENKERMANLIYKVTSNEHSGLKREFTNKKDAKRYAAIQKKDGWTAKVVDMRTGEEVK